MKTPTNSLPPSHEMSSVREAYRALRRAYRIASKDLMGGSGFAVCAALSEAGRKLTGNWTPFDKLAPRGDHWTNAKAVYTPTNRLGCYRMNVWQAQTIVLARWRLEDALAVA